MGTEGDGAARQPGSGGQGSPQVSQGNAAVGFQPQGSGPRTRQQEAPLQQVTFAAAEEPRLLSQRRRLPSNAAHRTRVQRQPAAVLGGLERGADLQPRADPQSGPAGPLAYRASSATTVFPS